MLLDTLGLVSDAQALTATAMATDKVDLEDVTPRREIGTGEMLGFGVSVKVAADFTTGDETYQIDLVSDEDPVFGSPIVIASYILTAAQLVLGAGFFIPLPPGFPVERYLTLRYVLAGTTPTVTLTAWLTLWSMFSQQPQTYARGYVV